MSEIPFFNQLKLQDMEDERLSPFAIRSSNSSRRIKIRDEGREYKFRTEFQRDRDRIIHSRAFRRLKHKTQVFVPYDGDHQRTRLTHTIEVSQISRTVARALNLNEDLAEAIACGHDLGHTPFGHSGEDILNNIMTGIEPLEGISPAVLKKAGGFKHNYQSLRTVDLLEKRYDYNGINLTDDTREGILKHTSYDPERKYPDLITEGLNLDMAPQFEAQVVSVSDEVAQIAHDLEDGMRAGEVPLQKIEELQVGQHIIKHLGSRYTDSRSTFLKQNMMIRGMIHLFVTNIVMTSGKNLEEWSKKNDIDTAQKFYDSRSLVEDRTIWFNDEAEKLYHDLKGFVRKWIINSFHVNRADGRAKYFLRKIFEAYYNNPLQLENYVLIRFREKEKIRYLRDIDIAEQEEELKTNYRGNHNFIRMICDHIAGMSDAYALREFEKLFIPYQLNTTAVK